MRTSISLRHQDVCLRPLAMSDWREVERLMIENRAWLKPWEATNPEGPTSFDIRGLVRSLVQQQRQKTSLTFVIEYQNRMVGLMNVANIVFGSLSSAIAGYWIIPSVAGRGITPTALALTTDYLFEEIGLHRVEVAIRPENTASLRVVEKLKFRHEGLKKRYIHINYDWRDHEIFALTREDMPNGVLNTWINTPTN